MTTLRLLRVLSALVGLVLGLVADAVALPFPTVTFHGTPLSQSFSSNPCDTLDCEGFSFGSVTDMLPQFGLVGETLLTAQITYDVRTHASGSLFNQSNTTVIGSAGFETMASFFFGQFPFPFFFSVEDQDFGGGGAIVLPGHFATIQGGQSQVSGTLVLLPGDDLFSLFLGHGGVEFRALTSAIMIGDVGAEDCTEFGGPPPVCQAQLFVPIIFAREFLGAYDLTYRYCTPDVDLGCPAAIVGFNSPVPAPTTLFLFAAGIIGLAWWRRVHRRFSASPPRLPRA